MVVYMYLRKNTSQQIKKNFNRLHYKTGTQFWNLLVFSDTQNSVFKCGVLLLLQPFCYFLMPYYFSADLTHCGRVTQICVFNTVKPGTSASSPQCHSTKGNVSRGITPSSTTRVFSEYFLKMSVHKNSQRICYKFLKKHSIKVD